MSLDTSLDRSKGNWQLKKDRIKFKVKLWDLALPWLQTAVLAFSQRHLYTIPQEQRARQHGRKKGL